MEGTDLIFQDKPPGVAEVNEGGEVNKGEVAGDFTNSRSQ